MDVDLVKPAVLERGLHLRGEMPWLPVKLPP
jgi:hypothetical protein